jgi:hypothetical protein
MKRYFLIGIALSVNVLLFAAKPDPALLVSLIPDSLKTNAYAVLLLRLWNSILSPKRRRFRNVIQTITVPIKRQ